MTRLDISRLLLVPLFLAPLIAFTADAQLVPTWLSTGDLFGIPRLVCLTALSFVAMMLLAWRIALAEAQVPPKEPTP